MLGDKKMRAKPDEHNTYEDDEMDTRKDQVRNVIIRKKAR